MNCEVKNGTPLRAVFICFIADGRNG